MRLLPPQSFDQSPAEMSYYAVRLVSDILGCEDPFADEKHKSNAAMLELYPELKSIVDSSQDKLHTAVKLTAAGNIIDMGILREFDVNDAIDDVLERSFQIDHFEFLRKDLEKAKSILYLADNAGEIVADKLFLETLDRNDVVVAVNERPILNDATMEDAIDAGLTKIVTVIDNGSDGPGTILETCSEEFLSCMDQSDLIIAKGQGNYETLSDLDKNIYFILKAKCPVVAADLGCDIGQMVLKRNQATENVNL